MNTTGPRLSTGVVFAGILLSLSMWNCFFDAGLPFKNDRPEFTDASEIDRVLLYPDSTICTLSVADFNDSLLAVSILPCDTSSSGACTGDSAQTTEWPGECYFLSGGLGEKRMVLEWASATMGVFRGHLQLSDAAGATATLPYSIRRQFSDPFDETFDAHHWQLYAPDDSSHIGYDYIDGKLVFTFDRDSETSEHALSTGIHSKFSLSGDFSIAVDFKLRDEMDEGFEVGFFISTSPDTGRWDGEKAGIFISGTEGRLRFECRSVDLQSYSFETSITGGVLGIRRSDSMVSYFFHDGNPSVEPAAEALHAFSSLLPIFVHLKMSVDDSSRDRNCYWNDFIVTEGTLQIPNDSL